MKVLARFFLLVVLFFPLPGCPTLAVTIRAQCPPPGFIDDANARQPFEWTEITENTEITSSDGSKVSIMLKSDKVSFDAVGEALIHQENTSVTNEWSFRQFSILGPKGEYGPIYTIACSESRTGWIDTTDAKFHFFQEGTG